MNGKNKCFVKINEYPEIFLIEIYTRDNIHKSKMKVNQGKVLNTFIINLQRLLNISFVVE